MQPPQGLGRVRSEDGSTLVETGISFVLLMTMIFGILAISLALYTYNFVADAAREGSRYAMVRGSTCKNPDTSSCKATLPGDIQTYVRGLRFPAINPSAITVTTNLPNGNQDPGSPIQVTVQYRFPLAIPFISARTLTMTSSSQMVISQ